MVSKNEIKLITSLSQKKYRKIHQLFVAEGVKLVEEFVNSDYTIHNIYATDDYSGEIALSELTIVSKKELNKLSNLHTANTILGVFTIPMTQSQIDSGLQVVLDGVKDPGNLGTIIRLCDWFGVRKLICSLDTVDCYNPKVVQASMGSLSRVLIEYVAVVPFLEQTKLPVYCSLLEGENVYHTALASDAIIVMGNEANGIRKEILNIPNKALTIPQFGAKKQAESLNVAMATSIFLSEFKR
jgi:TrmH family RNA methyltransferase